MSRCCGVPAGALQDQVRRGLVTQNQAIGVLPAREGIDALGWREMPADAGRWAELNDARHRFQTQDYYCSVLDECWTSDLSPTESPHHVATCEPDPASYTG